MHSIDHHTAPVRQHVAFLHTSPVHIETFDHLIKAADPLIQVEHIVAEDLLAEAQRVGADDPALAKRIQAAMVGATSHGATIVVCTCSTIGGPAERTPMGPGCTAVRIDRAMADRAVQLGPRILIVAALESTLGPTTKLIQESADALGTKVELEYLLVSSAWPQFLQGDRAGYLETVIAAVRSHPTQATVVVLAQASMALAADTLADLGIEVLASPTLGVQSILAHQLKIASTA